MEFSYLFIRQLKSLPWGLGPPVRISDLALTFCSSLIVGPSSLELTGTNASAATLGLSAEAVTLSSVGFPRWYNSFLDASRPKPNCQLQSDVQNFIRIHPQESSLWRPTQCNPTTILLVVAIASKLLTSESQALMHPAGCSFHHSLQVVAPPVAFNNTVRNSPCTTTTCNSF